MALKDYAERKQKTKKRRVAPLLGGVLVIVVVIAVVAFYDMHSGPMSNTVYCGVFQYLEFPAQTISGSSTMNVTETMTTAVSYTTTTSIAGRIGSTTSNATTTVNPDGRGAGVETICKYISDTSSSKSS